MFKNISFGKKESVDDSPLGIMQRASAQVADDPSILNQNIRELCRYLGSSFHEKADQFLATCIVLHASRFISTIWTVLLQQLRECESTQARLSILSHFANITERIVIPQRQNAFRVFAKEIMVLFGSPEIVGDRKFARSCEKTVMSLGVHAEKELCQTLLEKLTLAVHTWKRQDARRNAAMLCGTLLRYTRQTGSFLDYFRSEKGSEVTIALLLDSCTSLLVDQAKGVCGSRWRTFPDCVFVYELVENWFETHDLRGDPIVTTQMISTFERLGPDSFAWSLPKSVQSAIEALGSSDTRPILRCPLLSFLKNVPVIEKRNEETLISLLRSLIMSSDPMLRAEAFQCMKHIVGETEEERLELSKLLLSHHKQAMEDRCNITIKGILAFAAQFFGNVPRSARANFLHQIVRSHLDFSNSVNTVPAIQIQLLTLIEHCVTALSSEAMSYVLSACCNSDAELVRDKGISVLLKLCDCSHLEVLQLCEPALRGIDFAEGCLCNRRYGIARQDRSTVERITSSRNLTIVLSYFHDMLIDSTHKTGNEGLNLLKSVCSCLVSVGELRRELDEPQPLHQYTKLSRSLADVCLSQKSVPLDAFALSILSLAATVMRSSSGLGDIFFHKEMFVFCWNLLHCCCAEIDSAVVPSLPEDPSYYVCKSTLGDTIVQKINAASRGAQLSARKDSSFFNLIQSVLTLLVALLRSGRCSSIFVAHMKVEYRVVFACLSIVTSTHPIEALKATTCMLRLVFFEERLPSPNKLTDTKLQTSFVKCVVPILNRSLAFDLSLVSKSVFSIIAMFADMDTCSGGTACYSSVDESMSLFRRMMAILSDETYYNAVNGHLVIPQVIRAVAAVMNSPHRLTALQFCGKEELQTIEKLLTLAEENCFYILSQCSSLVSSIQDNVKRAANLLCEEDPFEKFRLCSSLPMNQAWLQDSEMTRFLTLDFGGTLELQEGFCLTLSKFDSEQNLLLEFAVAKKVPLHISALEHPCFWEFALRSYPTVPLLDVADDVALHNVVNALNTALLSCCSSVAARILALLVSDLSVTVAQFIISSPSLFVKGGKFHRMFLMWIRKISAAGTTAEASDLSEQSAFKRMLTVVRKTPYFGESLIYFEWDGLRKNITLFSFADIVECAPYMQSAEDCTKVMLFFAELCERSSVKPEELVAIVSELQKFRDHLLPTFSPKMVVAVLRALEDCCRAAIHEEQVAVRYAAMFLVVLMAPDKEHYWQFLFDSPEEEFKDYTVAREPVLNILLLAMELQGATVEEVCGFAVSIFLHSSALSRGINESILWLVIKCVPMTTWSIVASESYSGLSDAATLLFLCKMNQTVGMSRVLVQEVHAQFTPLLLSFGKARDLDIDAQRGVLWLTTSLLLHITISEERHTKPKAHMSLVDSLSMYLDYPLEQMGSHFACHARKQADALLFPSIVRQPVVDSEKNWNVHSRLHLLSTCGRQTLPKSVAEKMFTSILHMYAHVAETTFADIGQSSPYAVFDLFYSLGSLSSANSPLLKHSPALEGTVGGAILKRSFLWYGKFAAPFLSNVEKQAPVSFVGLFPESTSTQDFVDTYCLSSCVTVISSLHVKGNELLPGAVNVSYVLEKMLSMDLFAYQCALTAVVVTAGASTRKEMMQIGPLFTQRCAFDVVQSAKGFLSYSFGLLQIMRSSLAIVSALPDERVTMKVCESIWNVVVVRGLGGRRIQHYAHFLFQSIINMHSVSQAQWGVLRAIVAAPLTMREVSQNPELSLERSVSALAERAASTIQEKFHNFKRGSVKLLDSSSGSYQVRTSHIGRLRKGVVSTTIEMLHLTTTASFTFRSHTADRSVDEVDRNRVDVLDLLRFVEEQPSRFGLAVLSVVSSLVVNILDENDAMFVFLNRFNFSAASMVLFSEELARTSRNHDSLVSLMTQLSLFFDTAVRRHEHENNCWWTLANLSCAVLSRSDPHSSYALQLSLQSFLPSFITKEVCVSALLHFKQKESSKDLRILLKSLESSCRACGDLEESRLTLVVLETLRALLE